MNLSVLIPWRSGDPDRIAAWDHNRQLWERLGVQLCVADDGRTEGPFSVARAVNAARAQATGDGLVLFGADHIPPSPEKLAWIADRLERQPWSGVYAATRVFSPTATLRVLGGRPPALVAQHSLYIGMCHGIIAVLAEVWDDVGGEDERFEGWGAEDSTLRLVLRTLYPAGIDAGEGEAWALYHADRHGSAELTAANVARFGEYEAAAAAGSLRDYLEEVRRDRPGDDG